ncbi:MAG: MATE family efflux transporter [Oscillospiraceae bacterium]|nr:MATE family efflux transporter [Oscillospiraceae bacterium]
MSSLSKFFTAQDMTVGTPWKKIVSFAIPLLIGNIAQQLYNTADSVIVGKYVGDSALAAVGGCGPTLNLLIVLFVGIATGAGIMVSQYFGAKQKEDLSHSVGTCLTLTLIASLIMMVVGTVVAAPMLRLLQTPPEAYDMCVDYMRIYFLGIAGMGFYNIASGILRGLGDSLSALKYLIIATVLNVGLDIFFVAKLNMAVAGVAIATVIAQFISAVLCLRKLLSMRDVMHLRREHFGLNKRYAIQLIKLGLPSGLSQAVMSCSALVVQSLTNSFGVVFMACNTTVMRIDGFVMMPNFSFGNAMTTYTGQNVGAGDIDRVRQGAKVGTSLAVGTAAVLVALILVFCPTLMGFFTDTPQLIEMSTKMMRIVAPGYIAFAITQCMGGVMRGAGDTATPMWLSFFTTIVIRVPLAYLLAYLTRSEANPKGDPASIFISLLISWLVGALIHAIAYKKGKWRNKVQSIQTVAE